MSTAWTTAGWPLLTPLSPAGRRGRLSILIFHRVLPAPDPLRPGEPTVDRFRWQMALVARLFNVLPLSEAVARLQAGTLPARAAAITFDDGYADNHALALPVLRGLGLPATFFIATGFLDGGRMFNDTVIEAVRHYRGEVDLAGAGLGCREIHSDADRCELVRELLPRLKYADPETREGLLAAITARSPSSLPDTLMMTAGQVAELADGGMEVGAHTVRHPILTRLTREEARWEMDRSKSDLEEIVGAPVRLFAYPNGRYGEDYGDEHVRLVREVGFSAAVSTHPGAARRGEDPFQLPRFTPWDRTAPRFAARLARNLMRGPAPA